MTPKATDTPTSASDAVDALSGSLKESFESDRRLISFEQYLDLVSSFPERFARNSAQYLLDALDHFGTIEVKTGRGPVTRYSLFDAPFDEGAERVVGNEATQQELARALRHFDREGRINRLIVIHGPNGSAKSSFVSCVMRALEAYSRTEEGALYRFNWIFPAATVDTGRIGFEGRRAGTRVADGSYAFLDDRLIDSKLASEHNDNPLFILPRAARERFLAAAFAGREFPLSDTVRKGDLGHRSRAVFDALLASYRGDFSEVVRHVQVERYYISKRYRRGAVTVEPQLRVDAGVRQLTVDRSLNALPRALQSQTLFEVFGPLVEGNRGIVEYNDLLKRPMDANKYLLATSEKGTVSLDTGEMHIDTVLIATVNEQYLEGLKEQPDWPSYKGRFSLVRMPYLLDYRQEQEIYDNQLEGLQLGKPVAPHTTMVAALWAVLTRLMRPTSEGFDSSIAAVIDALDPVEKAFLYSEGTLPGELSAEQSQQLRLAIGPLMKQGAGARHYEGRYGASPRELKTVILDAAHQDAETLSPTHIFAAIRRLIADSSVYEWLRIEPDGPYHRPEEFIEAVRKIHLDRVEREVRDATGLVDPTEYQRVFERYVSHANHWLRGEKLKDELTGAMHLPDERFMEEVENTLGREEDPRPFRNHLIARVAAFRIDNPDAPVDFETIFPDFFDRMREQYFRTKHRVLRRIQRSVLSYLDDPELTEPQDVELVETTLRALEQRYGYVEATAREAIGLLLRERYRSDDPS